MRERNQVQEVEDWGLVSIDMNTLNIYQGEKIVFVSGNAKFFWNFGMYISSHLFIGPWVHCEGPQWRARPVCRQDSTSHPTLLFLHDLHYENHTRISTTGTMEIGEGITLHPIRRQVVVDHTTTVNFTWRRNMKNWWSSTLYGFFWY